MSVRPTRSHLRAAPLRISGAHSRYRSGRGRRNVVLSSASPIEAVLIFDRCRKPPAQRGFGKREFKACSHFVASQMSIRWPLGLEPVTTIVGARRLMHERWKRCRIDLGPEVHVGGWRGPGQLEPGTKAGAGGRAPCTHRWPPVGPGRRRGHWGRCGSGEREGHPIGVGSDGPGRRDLASSTLPAVPHSCCDTLTEPPPSSGAPHSRCVSMGPLSAGPSSTPSSWPEGIGHHSGHQRRLPWVPRAGGGRLLLPSGHRHSPRPRSRCRSPAGSRASPGPARPRSPLLPHPPPERLGKR
jgi:hypothetical protein